jgi:hypothetical protein
MPRANEGERRERRVGRRSDLGGIVARSFAGTTMEDGLGFCHQSAFVRTTLQREFGLDASERIAADYDLGLRLLKAGKRFQRVDVVIAEFLTGKTFATALSTTPAPRAMCTPRNAAFDPGANPTWSGWGKNTSNTRYQDTPGLAATDVPKLKLKWAFAFPGASRTWAQPAPTRAWRARCWCPTEPAR